MPPKKNEPSKKTDQKKKEKVIEDKTFGLKNKKGAKQQKFIKTVVQQVKFGNVKSSKLKEGDDKDKTKKKKEQEELNSLFKPVTQTVSKGVDPKSVVCAFFKQGQCSKGAKCKFSHDLNLTRKGEKKNIYEDVRDDENEEDDIKNWDEAKLEDVINKKHGEEDLKKPKTTIICKFFLEAVESQKYGWFWSCPNGGDACMYRHALPPGFVLKKDQKKEDKGDELSLEELIEKERAALGANTTRVTLETFLTWKDKKRKEKEEKMRAEQDKKKSDFKSGRMLGISGRELFEFNPDFVADDDEEATDETIEREEEEDEGNIVELDFNKLANLARESDGTGTVSTSHFRIGETSTLEPTYGKPVENNYNEGEERNKLSEAAGGSGDIDEAQKNTDEAIAVAMSATMNGDMTADMPIDEDLFAGEDLDQVEEDLETLELED
ncbi:hypothetical protein ACJMK2_014560 [Sinanodonta woodiana]|uniref:C3H1-type domain-containing protein n=1 Tax=Sinanodonta woodiana TaxID=1069815 RepID=A0ABD3V130_SINWO